MSVTVSESPYEVTGVVVRARPERAAAVADRLAAMPGVEIHAIGDEGNLVVTIEEQGGEKIAVDTLSAMASLPGVIATSLVYHHADTDSTVQESTHEAD